MNINQSGIKVKRGKNPWQQIDIENQDIIVFKMACPAFCLFLFFES